MKRFICAAASVLLLSASLPTLAQQYNKVPAGNTQYSQCQVNVNKQYTGGAEPSPIKGQNKAQAWCTCLWNETPDDFKGDLVKFAETRKGKETSKVCEKYADWG